MIDVSRGAWLLVSWTVTFAAFLLVHCATLVRALRAPAMAPRWKACSLIPIVTPFVAWRAGSRALPVLWGCLAITYAVLRAVE